MFRTLGKSKIAFILAILFGISLFFFRGSSRYSNLFNSDNVIAKVSGTPISTNRFNREMQLQINQFNQMLGKSITKDEIRALQVHTRALGTLIHDAIFENEYDKINLKIDQEVIAQKTKESIPELYDSNNNLNERYLSTILQQQQLQIADIVQIINFETRDKYFNEAFFEIGYPQHFSNKINSFNKHKRKVSYVELPLDKVNIDNIIQEYSSNLKTELERYYNENIRRYMSKEKRNIEYFILDKQLLSSNFSPSDFEIEEYYNLNKELYFKNEKRSFIQFNFKATEDAENFKQKIQTLNLQQILDYVKENNIFYSEFENLEANEILKEIAEPLYNLNVGQQSNIIETSLYKHIVILKSIQPPSQLDFYEVKNDIKKIITDTETNNYYNDISAQISEKIINGESLFNIAKTYNLKKMIIENLTQDYNDYDNSEEIIFTNLISDSFTSNKDFVSDVIKINENISYVFNVTNITLSSPLYFEDIVKIVEEDWNISKKIEKIKLELKDNINNKAYLSMLSEKYNLYINDLTLTMNSDNLPRILVNNIFQSEQDQNTQALNENIFYVAKISDIIMPNEKNNLKPTFLTNNLRNSFAEELIKDKKITTNDSLIKAIIEQQY